MVSISQFSVVVPLYNKAPHVRQTIESVLAQTFQPGEVLVIDDGSTDGGLEIVEAMRSPLVRVIRRDRPGPGGYAARNVGVMAARGEWIAFLDADDQWRLDHLACFAAALASAGDDIGCVFGRHDIVGAGPRRTAPVARTLLADPVRVDFRRFLLAWLETNWCPMWTGATGFRRDTLIAAGLFPEGRVVRGGDKDLWLRVMAISNAAFSAEITAEFHQDTVNRVTHNTRTVELPMITHSIRDLIPRADAETVALLRRLSNQQIALYARYASAGRSGVNRSFRRSIYLPEGMATLAMVVGFTAVSRPLSWLRRVVRKRHERKREAD